MQAILVVLFMIVIGAVIGGVTNMIAVKMLFHPFKAYYIFGKRVPFTPGLIPKRREEIAEKIGQVVEDHLLTESLMREKLETPDMRATVHRAVSQQVEALEQDHVTLQSLVERFDIHVVQDGENFIDRYTKQKLNEKYALHQTDTMAELIPPKVMAKLDEKVGTLDTLLLERARIYLDSDKGYKDILEMLETFFVEKGKIVSMLQMFMTKEAIAERIQRELIRLTSHSKAKTILATQIQAEYEKLKSGTLQEWIKPEQMAEIEGEVSTFVLKQIDLKQRAHMPLKSLVPQMFEMLHDRGIDRMTDLILDTLAKRLSTILKQVNIRGLVEEQINRFDLDYIEQLIFEIANKELKLIMLLGFILGGIIGFFQGLIAIFV
ncbi:DUF445 domain-containing protein [Staphylococcus intermedius]|uniref:Membrane protein n=2 Tax=Staphylococcus TaxID=1279 RepID=A0A380G591_STAIN|nr:DUF445 family protein [Staphylococcus intermedius]PCF64514.1 hypothetical protein B5C04_00215 [Staphylococcus intermedius]PCF80122.1 hypothetical protein B4W74_00220 [Staphylococcus intermedius]PCF81473.1 hypothetical protein B4W70_00215 [Staphylococcus intermedius]PCF84661.1 hypothetical protein B4W76_11450 [Staphylococcus intermedius]PCF86026.1 hypothetical protein B4W75_11745 [Staphylococcus intermedius]